MIVEFALIALALYLLIAVIADLGRAVYTAQVLQDAARVAARELSVTSLAADLTFEQALQDPLVQARVFDPGALVIDLDAFPTPGDLDAYLGSLPALNKALRPVMIFDRVEVAGVARNLLRYPGALLSDPGSPSGFTVGIPRVNARSAEGVETIEWLPVVSEVRPDPADPATGPFSVNDLGAPRADRGLVALAIQYPFQAAASSSFRPNPAGPFEPNLAFPNEADDGAVTEINAPPSGTVLPLDPGLGPYAGRFGLGRQLALGREVRPFRRLITAQALYRREVYE